MKSDSLPERSPELIDDIFETEGATSSVVDFGSVIVLLDDGLNLGRADLEILRVKQNEVVSANDASVVFRISKERVAIESRIAGTADSLALSPSSFNNVLGKIIESVFQGLRELGFTFLHSALLKQTPANDPFEKALTLTGGSRTGKSSLSVALSAFDFEVLADDLLFFRFEDAGVRFLALRRELRVRNLELKSGIPDELPRLPSEHEFVFSKGLGTVVFPRFEENASLSLTRMESSEAFRQVLLVQSLENPIGKTPTPRHIAGRDFQNLGRLFRDAECYQITYCDERLSDAAQLLNDALSG